MGLLGGRVLGSFDELAIDEGRSGADERDQVGGVDHAPAALRGLDQLEGHRQPGGLRPVTLGDLRPQPDGNESRFNRVGGAQMRPALGAASRRFSWDSAIYLTALPGQLELETSSGCAPVNAAAAVGSLRS